MPDSKWCPDCSHLQPADRFYRSGTSLDGLSTYCRKCERVRDTERARQRAASPPPVLPAVKRCGGPCGRVLPLAAFPKQASGADRHFHLCHQCAALRHRQQSTGAVDSM